MGGVTHIPIDVCFSYDFFIPAASTKSIFGLLMVCMQSYRKRKPKNSQTQIHQTAGFPHGSGESWVTHGLWDPKRDACHEFMIASCGIISIGVILVLEG